MIHSQIVNPNGHTLQRSHGIYQPEKTWQKLLNEKTLKKLPEIVSLLQLGLGKGKYGIIASSKRIS